MTTLNYGIPSTTQGAQFEQEEQAAAAARGQGNPFAGWTLPTQWAGDFWQLYSLAETFAANTGWKYLLTPQQLIEGLQAGLHTADQQSVFEWFTWRLGIDQTAMPWARVGMNATQYKQASNNLSDTLYGLIGQSDMANAGLGAVQYTALMQNWSAQKLRDYINQNPALASQYGYLKYEQTNSYSAFQSYKIQNAQSLRSRYGHNFTDQQAIANLGDPLESFHAQGSAFGQQAPFVAAQSVGPTGFQSSVR